VEGEWLLSVEGKSVSNCESGKRECHSVGMLSK